jgi:hypothetical protein
MVRQTFGRAFIQHSNHPAAEGAALSKVMSFSALNDNGVPRVKGETLNGECSMLNVEWPSERPARRSAFNIQHSTFNIQHSSFIRIEGLR